MRRSRGERLGLLFVRGPAGIGKSTLLRELADDATAAGRQVRHLHGSATADARETPRAIRRRALRRLRPGSPHRLLRGAGIPRPVLRDEYSASCPATRSSWWRAGPGRAPPGSLIRPGPGRS
ncbi:hypothetical protein [Nonomuraea dietziae]|uniref:hypothetical protein n=1 Tax=Nonomuraea dietziae TaxID=65515 RepID=UPI003CD08E3C